MIDIAVDTLEKAAAGDLEAFERLYTVSSGFVYNVALRITHNSADAQEVTQDVFLKIYHKLKGFQFRSSFKTWVYRITANTAINYYRRSLKRNVRSVDFEDLAEKIPAAATAAESALARENEARLDALLKQLNPEYKVCLVLREIEGLTYLEIARALKIPVNTVRTRLKRGRQALVEAGRKGQVKDEMY